ncbi:MAG: MBL fold metallo-hydrolase [Gemmatimonadetes bacterium]|nr:MBL fold metallo-hydrolase [Gemmatimonadota bacterium]
MAATAAAPSPDSLEVRFLDVGRADAILIRQGAQAVLVDAGNPANDIAGRLRDLGVDSLQAFIASHEHGDHIGSAGAVLGAMPVRRYIDNGTQLRSQAEEQVSAALDTLDIPVEHAPRTSVRLEDAVIDVMPPAGRDTAQNNRSLILLVRRGRFRALLTGDSQREEVDAMLVEDSLPDVDVLKAPHHGDPTVPTEAWLARLSPEVVVVPVTTADLDPETPRVYAAPGRTVLITGRSGDVSVLVDAAGAYVVRTQRPDTSGEPGGS